MIIIDNTRRKEGAFLWCWMMNTTADNGPMHRMCRELRIPPWWFSNGWYKVRWQDRDALIAQGVVPVTNAEMMRKRREMVQAQEQEKVTA